MRLLRALRSGKVRAFLWGVFLLLLLSAAWWTLAMPGRSWRGPLPPLSPEEQQLSAELSASVEYLAGELGPRNCHTLLAQRQTDGELEQARDWIQAQLEEAGYEVSRQTYAAEGREYANLDCQRKGSGPELVVLGAHYDTFPGTPGADDNASGVAALLALARRLHDSPAGTRSLRFVAFTNEEPYFFQTPTMGSLVYARRCRERNEPIAAMLSLETIGYYKDQPGSQKYPFPLGLLYPDTGNFIAFVGTPAPANRSLVHRTLASFRSSTKFPSEGAAAPAAIPGIGWSDHWSFWQAGYPAIMVTDTAPFRNPDYHTERDLPDHLDYDRMARVVLGLQRVLEELTR